MQVFNIFLFTILAGSGAWGQQAPLCGEFDKTPPKASFSEYDSTNDSMEIVLQDADSGILGYNLAYPNNGEWIERTYAYIETLDARNLFQLPISIGEPPLSDTLEKEKKIYLVNMKSAGRDYLRVRVIDGCGFVSPDVIWQE